MQRDSLGPTQRATSQEAWRTQVLMLDKTKSLITGYRPDLTAAAAAAATRV